MSQGNTTRAAASARSDMLQVTSYRVHLDLNQEGTTFPSTSTIELSTKGGDSFVDIIAESVTSASLDGEPFDISGFDGFTLPFSAPEGEHTLEVTAQCRYSNSGEGLHRFTDPADGRVYLYSQFESADARRAFACFDQPDLKARFSFVVDAPLDWKVISNSAAVEPEEISEGIGRWSFAATEPMSTYITAIVAGPYHVVTGTIQSAAGEVPASIACRQSKVEHLDAERIFDITAKGFEVFEKHFGHPYAFGTYDQVFVPEFNFGAMENAGCVILRDEYLFRSRVTSREYEARDNTILHELAHMWFGDLVTMRWWDDLWLNESFAEWASHFCQAELAKADPTRVDPWVSFANERKTWAYLQDQMPTTHPIAADMVDLETVEQNFDGITYAKGASVLKLLVSFVGEEAFLEGVRNYFAEFAFGNTQLSDLLHHLQVASGRDLSWFIGEWLETSGVNTLRADFDLDEEGRFTRFEIVQSAHPDYPTLRTHRVGVGIFALDEAGLTRQHRLNVDVAGERTSIEALVGVHRGDLILLNDGDLTYAKTRLDPQSLETAVEHLDKLSDPLARAMVWACAWDMTRDAEMTSADYVQLVTGALATETDATAISTVLRQGVLAATSYTAPELRDAVQKAYVAGIVRLLKAADPGSDAQVALASTLISLVFTQTGTELIRGWLTGEEVPEGLVIDTDMRWKIMTALAALGAIDEDDIAAEAERDKTSAGAEKAAGVISALADAESKEEAWELATADADVPNETHRQICGNFFQFRQEELLAPYGDRYVDVLTAMSEKSGVWASRGSAAREAILRFLVPAPLATAEFVDKLQAWLDAGERNEQVVRGVRERIDGFRRALKCQDFSRARAEIG